MRGRKQNPELDQIADLYRKGLSIRRIADKLGRKHQAVYAILKARNVQMRESPSQLNGRKPKDEVLYHRGNRYTWTSKGYWRCTSYHDRHNLARRIWEENFGPIPTNFEVYYKDGDRFNLKPENLGCLSRSERQKERLKDPLYRASIYAYGCYARLNKAISDTFDPSRASARMHKAWVTRRTTSDPKESARKAHETRKALYGKSGVKDPEAVRKRLSEAHKGISNKRRKV